MGSANRRLHERVVELEAALSAAKKDAEENRHWFDRVVERAEAAESSRDKYKKALEKFKIYMISAKDTYSKKDPTRVVWETAFNLMIERFAEVEEALKEKEGV